MKEKKIEEVSEEIDAMGQESEIKASHWVKEKGKEWDQETEQEQGKTLEILKGRTKYKFADYKRFLGKELMRRGWEEGYPKDWMFQSVVTDNGIVYYLRSPEKRLFVRGTKIIHYPIVSNYTLEHPIFRITFLPPSPHQFFSQKAFVVCKFILGSSL